MADGQVLIEITADNRGAKQTIRETTQDLTNASNQWENAGNKMSGIFSKIAAAAATAKIGQFLLNLGKDAVQAASDLAEVQNVVDVTFGDSADVINRWAKNAITQFGLTETQAKRFASTMGAMMKSSGLAGDDIVKMSTDLAGLAADMASFYNLDFETAFQKIRSGISGETEPLKQLGINMSVANLEAFALTQGITKAFNSMSQGEQVMLRYQYMLQATSDAQGDFARTQDSFANSTRLLQNNIDTLITKLGAPLSSAVTMGINAINELLAPLINPPRTILDDFAEIDLDKETKIQEIQEIRAEAQELVNILNELTEAGYNPALETVTEVAGKLPKIEQGQPAEQQVNETANEVGQVTEGAAEIMKRLGIEVKDANSAQEIWIATCRRLVQLLPELGSIIDTETWQIDGGTQAVLDYVDAWAQTKEVEARIEALAKMMQALKDAMFTSEADVKHAKARARAQLSIAGYTEEDIGRIADLAERLSRELNEAGMTVQEAFWGSTMSGNAPLAMGGNDELIDLVHILQQLDSKSRELLFTWLDVDKAFQDDLKIEGKAYEYIQDEYNDMVDRGISAQQIMDGITNATEKAATAARELSQEEKTAWEAAFKGAEDAAKAIADYQQKTVDTVRNTLSGWAGTFGEVVSKDQKALADIRKDLKDLSGEEYTTQYNIAVGSSDIQTAGKMLTNLKQRESYLYNYSQFMETARQMGYSNEVLAQLADGSLDSYDSLRALVQGDSSYVQKINQAYEDMVFRQDELAETLGGYQLSADEEFHGLVNTLEDSMNTLDAMSPTDAPALAVGATIDSVLAAIQARYPALESWVQKVSLALGALSNMSYSGGHAPGVGGFNVAYGYDGSFANGLDYVPFDGFIAQVHRGEAILTAQEAQVWRDFRNGLDANSIAGAIWDNSPNLGGNVYLNGETVGRIMSAEQANSYRQLERSGWRG